ncbi:MAG: hypothetical protein WCL23_04180 [Candidatus Moraniibacteriota bacterium]
MNTDNLFVIFGPSGSGQDSVIEGIAKRMPIERVITSTTRPMRTGETQQHPYWFVSREHFEDGIANDSFIEWAKTYNDEFYGVTRDEIERVGATGKVGIWKVDWRGAKSVRSLFPEIPVLFITAPLENIRERIFKRDNPTESYFKERMEYIEDLLNRSDLVYDYEIKNPDGGLENAIDQAVEIIRGRFGR